MAHGLASQSLSFWWILPFGGMLGSLALMPLLAIHFWEAHYGKIAFGWSFITIAALLGIFGIPLVQTEILGTLFHHYLPFIIMIGALYTISGGIQIDVEASATPAVNTALLVIGTLLAGWIGTTGASMLLIRPMLHVNRKRSYRVHHMIFFIFLVANIGGALTPLGDPPLFLGFLNGVSFFWPTQHLILPMIVMVLPLLILFYGIDAYFVSKEGIVFKKIRPQLNIKGKLNGFLFLGVIGFVLLSGLWHPTHSLTLGGVPLELQNLLRDSGLVLLAILSWVLTPSAIHKANRFSWEPLKEVAKLFFGIFITVIPVIAILNAGPQGAMAPLVALVEVGGQPHNTMYFWLTGLLSSFLDNAPTYLVFFNMAGGDVSLLMSTLSQTLVAISLGSVFMGAMTYIGNTPNFMVKSIAEGHNISMPSFFAYMAWSLTLLLPLFLLLSWWLF
ncbi:MAG: sodium:proton antiporter [Alphaproteobacteria bacterium]|nr:sodium:proton antiporter [Alphaproteobacteria bacterium]